MSEIYALSEEILELVKPYVPQNQSYKILSHNVNFAYLQLGLKPKDIYQLYGFNDVAGFVYGEWAKAPHTFAFVPKDFIILDKHHRLFKELDSIPRDEKHALELAQFKDFLNEVYPYKKIAQSEHFILFENTDLNHSHIKEQE